jgi:tetratricopeptide (TPR) repeat protein
VKLYFDFLEKKGRILKRMDKIEEKVLMFKEVYDKSRFKVTAAIHLQRAYLSEGYIVEMEKFCQEFDMVLLDTEARPSQRQEFMLNMEEGMKWKRDNIIRSRPLIGGQKMLKMLDMAQELILQGNADMALKELDKCWTRISSFIKDGVFSETHLRIMTLRAEANQQLGNWKEAERFLEDILKQKPYLIEARILWLKQLFNDRKTKETHDFGIATEEWIENTLTTANFFQIKDLKFRLNDIRNDFNNFNFAQDRQPLPNGRRLFEA